MGWMHNSEFELCFFSLCLTSSSVNTTCESEEISLSRFRNWKWERGAGTTGTSWPPLPMHMTILSSWSSHASDSSAKHPVLQLWDDLTLHVVSCIGNMCCPRPKKNRPILWSDSLHRRRKSAAGRERLGGECGKSMRAPSERSSTRCLFPYFFWQIL